LQIAEPSDSGGTSESCNLKVLNNNLPASPSQSVMPSRERVRVVLVVDDHDDTRALLRYVFEGHGYQVIEATDGDDAVTIAQQQRPDVIVMDASLKRVDGFEATRRIRRIPSISHLPIVFLSGHAQQKTRVDAIASGANDYLVKPVSLEQLERSVEFQIAAVAAERVARTD
jgi:two-component system cell cycle response regulator DivK